MRKVVKRTEKNYGKDILYELSLYKESNGTYTIELITSTDYTIFENQLHIEVDTLEEAERTYETKWNLLDRFMEG